MPNEKLSYRDIPKMTRNPNYRVCVDLKYLPTHLDRYIEEYALDCDPDFQRGHVWTEDKQVAFVEYMFRGGQSGREIYFNCPGWQSTYDGEMVLVDGKQRFEACRRYLNGEIPIFGHFVSEYGDRIPQDVFLYFNVNNLKTRAETLKWYLDLNDGGVVHTKAEISKVRHLLEEAL